jgi:2,5-furandicarboxylate decarboxylase 1
VKRDSLREFLGRLEEVGELRRIEREVDTRWEAAAFLKVSEKEGGPALFFQKIKGSPLPVAGNLYATRKRIALALGLTEEELGPAFQGLRQSLKPPRVVAQAPCQEVVLQGQDVDLGELPVLTHCEKDGGPYITAGLVTAKDPDSGDRAAALVELQVQGPRTLTISPVTPRLSLAYSRAEALGRPLEIAVAIGVEPAALLACCSPASLAGLDKFALAGGLKGASLALAKCKTVDLEVPASSEIVIEGHIQPGQRADMGPFGDYLGTYYWQERKPLVEVQAITRRRDAIYQAMLGDGAETALLITFPTEVDLYCQLRSLFPDVVAVHIPPVTLCHHAVVAINKRKEEDARAIILAALGSHFALKHIVVVDEDIDVRDPQQVEWAIATRVQADEDVFITPRLAGVRLDPSSRNGSTAKMGIDATRPLGMPAERFERSDVPPEVKRRVAQEWQRL